MGVVAAAAPLLRAPPLPDEQEATLPRPAEDTDELASSRATRIHTRGRT